MSVSPTTNAVANGTTGALVTVTVYDNNNNLVPNAAVTLSTPSAGATVTAATTTNASGVSTGYLNTLKSGKYPVGATAGSGSSVVAITQTGSATFTGDPSNVNTTASAVSVSPAANVPANGTAATVTIKRIDNNGNIIANAFPTISMAGGSAVNPPFPTDANGVTIGQVKSVTAGTFTVIVSANGTALAQQPTVTFIADTVDLSPLYSSCTASPTSNILANNVATTTVAVNIRDANGNAVQGATLGISAGAGSTTSAVPLTDVNGNTTATIKATLAGTKTIKATIAPATGAQVIAQQPTATFIADAGTISATNSKTTASPATGLVAGSSTSTITTIVQDANKNPVPNVTVVLASDANAQVTQPSAVTNAAGTVTGSITTLKSGTHTLTATVGSAGAGSLVTTWVAALQVDTGGTGYTLTATPANSTSLTTATSSAFSITCAGCRAPPSRLSWNGPSNSFWPALKIARGAELTAPREVRVGLLPPVGPVSLAQLHFALPDESPSAPAQLSPPAFVEPIPDVRSGHARLTLRRLPDPHSVTNARTVPLFVDERGTSGDEDDLLYLAATDEQGHGKLHRFDGTSFTQVAETNPLGDDNPTVLSIRDGRVLFRAVAADQTEQLFLLDGDQTTRVLDHSESLQAAPSAARIDYGSADWITRTDRSGMTQLLRKEGAGWSRLPDVVPGSHPKAPLRFRAALWVSLEDSRGAHLWRLCDASESCQP